MNNSKIKMFGFLALIMILTMSFAGFVSAGVYDYATIKITFLNQDPDPAEPGDYVELRWKVQKFGNDDLDGLQFQLEPEYPFSFDQGSSGFKDVGDFGTSDEDSYYLLYYKLRVDEDALEDTYQLNLKYKTGDNDWVEKEYDVRVGDKEKPEFVLGSISSSPTKLVGDIDEASISVDIENIGDGDAENVKVEVEFPNGFEPSYSFADRVVLGSIGAGESKTATFYVDLDDTLKGDIYGASAKISYKEEDDDDNVYKTLSLPLDIQVMNKPLFDIIDVSSVPESLTPGSVVELKIKIKNIGGKEAESVSLRAFKEASQPFEFDDKSDFVGKLLSGAEGEAVLKFTVESDAVRKDYLLDLEIRSVDDDQVIVQDKTIKLTVNGEDSSSNAKASPLVGGLIVAVIVLAGLVLFFAFKKQPMKKK